MHNIFYTAPDSEGYFYSLCATNVPFGRGEDLLETFEVTFLTKSHCLRAAVIVCYKQNANCKAFHPQSNIRTNLQRFNCQ